MKTKKKLQWNIKNWHLAILFPFTILCIIASILLIVFNDGSVLLNGLSYFFYFLAAITLGLSIYSIVKISIPLKDKIIGYLRKNNFINKLFEEYDFRNIVFSAINFIINICYVLFNGIIAIVSKSIWYGALAAYYLVLTLLRGSIVYYHTKNAIPLLKNATTDVEKRNKQAEIKIYILNGIMLLILPIALSFVILDIVKNGTAFVRWGWTVYAFAFMAFYKIIASIIQIVRSRKKSEDYTVHSLKNIGFAAALVTILSLQTSLLYSFGGGANVATFNAITGGIVCIITVIIGIIMIIKGSKKIKTLQYKNIEESINENRK